MADRLPIAPTMKVYFIPWPPAVYTVIMVVAAVAAVAGAAVVMWVVLRRAKGRR